MACKKLAELVSQAEREGVTLAEVISRTMSNADMIRAQRTLAKEMSENYCKIEDFMADVSVPSIEEVLMTEELFPVELVDEEAELSDDMLLDAH